MTRMDNALATKGSKHQAAGRAIGGNGTDARPIPPRVRWLPNKNVSMIAEQPKQHGKARPEHGEGNHRHKHVHSCDAGVS
jgi:hypothetical protein